MALPAGVAVCVLAAAAVPDEPLSWHMLQHSLLVGGRGAPDRVRDAVAAGARPAARRPAPARAGQRRGALGIAADPVTAWIAFVAVQWGVHLTALLGAHRGAPRAPRGRARRAARAPPSSSGCRSWPGCRSAARCAAARGALYLLLAVPAVDLVALVLMATGHAEAGAVMLAGMPAARRSPRSPSPGGGCRAREPPAPRAGRRSALEHGWTRRIRCPPVFCWPRSLAHGVGGDPAGEGARPGRRRGDPAGGAAARSSRRGARPATAWTREGIEGQAPILHGAGAAAADFYLSTGRMPLDRSRATSRCGPSRATQAQIDPIAAYVGSLGRGPRSPRSTRRRPRCRGPRGLHRQLRRLPPGGRLRAASSPARSRRASARRRPPRSPRRSASVPT